MTTISSEAQVAALAERVKRLEERPFRDVDQLTMDLVNASMDGRTPNNDTVREQLRDAIKAVLSIGK